MVRRKAAETTLIRIAVQTKSELDKIGNKGDTYEDVVRRLLEFYKAGRIHK